MINYLKISSKVIWKFSCSLKLLSKLLRYRYICFLVTKCYNLVVLNFSFHINFNLFFSKFLENISFSGKYEKKNKSNHRIYFCYCFLSSWTRWKRLILLSITCFPNFKLCNSFFRISLLVFLVTEKFEDWKNMTFCCLSWVGTLEQQIWIIVS